MPISLKLSLTFVGCFAIPSLFILSYVEVNIYPQLSFYLNHDIIFQISVLNNLLVYNCTFVSHEIPFKLLFRFRADCFLPSCWPLCLLYALPVEAQNSRPITKFFLISKSFLGLIKHFLICHYMFSQFNPIQANYAITNNSRLNLNTVLKLFCQ